MALLIAATALVVASHVLPSMPGIRERLIAALGRTAFHAGYSLISLITLGLLVVAYRSFGPEPWLYAPGLGSRLVALAVMPFALFLVIARLTTPAPPDDVIGIYRVCAVPGSLGVLLWTLVHLLNLGDPRAVTVFAGLALMTLFALIKNLVVAGPACRGVGWLPFAAILRGRELVVWREIGWWRVGLALAAYACLLALHPIIIDRDPLGGLW